jgi:hypothetical protein
LITIGAAGREEPLRVGAVWADIARHPYDYLVRRWNWKSAVTSVILRGAIFFFTNLGAGRDAAVSALLTEIGYRALLSGVIGSITQALRSSQPYWAAALTASVVLPAFAHVVEFTVHSLRGTPRMMISVSVSIGFSIVTVLFDLYAMRRGVLVVNSEHTSLLRDFAAMPRIIVGFVAAAPLGLWRLFRPRR